MGELVSTFQMCMLDSNPLFLYQLPFDTSSSRGGLRKSLVVLCGHCPISQTILTIALDRINNCLVMSRIEIHDNCHEFKIQKIHWDAKVISYVQDEDFLLH